MIWCSSPRLNRLAVFQAVAKPRLSAWDDAVHNVGHSYLATYRSFLGEQGRGAWGGDELQDQRCVLLPSGSGCLLTFVEIDEIYPGYDAYAPPDGQSTISRPFRSSPFSCDRSPCSPFAQ